LFSLPKLSASGGSGKVNESINLTATTTDGKNNPFKDGSIKWFVSPNKATVSGGKAGTFTSGEEGSYTVFFSGHSYLGDPLARQFVSAEVSVSKRTEQPQSAGEHGISGRCHSIKNNSHGIANQCSTHQGWSGSYDDKERKQGVWSYVYDDGDFWQETYSDGILNGYSGWWKADCSPKYSHGNYVNGRKNGVWTYFSSYTNDNDFWQETYSDGILNGYSGWWKADGSPTYDHGNYVNGKSDGIWTRIYSSDGSFSQSTYTSGVLNGYYGNWTVDCKPIGSHGNYVSGKREGVWTYVNSDGSYYQRTYVNDVLNGHFGEWKADGTPINLQGNYVNGEWDGVVTDINSDGSYDKHSYVAGILNGPFGEWKADGTPISFHGNYVNGEWDGVVTYYCSNGKLSYTVTYSNGESNGDYQGPNSCY